MENTSSPTPYRIAAAVIAVTTIAAGIFLFARRGGEEVGVTTTASSTANSPVITLPTPDKPVIKGDGYTIELLNDTNLPPAPNFKAPIAYSESTAPEVRVQLDKNIAIFVGRIEKDKYDLRSWVDLGTLHKMGGDYKTAAAVWTYVSKLSPKNATAFDNLGDLYQNFLKDYPKAEANWLASIKIDPKDTNPYRALFDLYNDLMKKPTAAEAIMKKGVVANPASVDLHVILARFYKTQGKTTDAQGEYKQAIRAAETGGQPDIATEIRTEAGL